MFIKVDDKQSFLWVDINNGDTVLRKISRMIWFFFLVYFVMGTGFYPQLGGLVSGPRL